MTSQHKVLNDIIQKAESGQRLSRQEITHLLDLNDRDKIEMLFQSAVTLRNRVFGNHIFLYGFIHTSTYCRNDCCFCYFRSSNSESTRYRKAKSDILIAAQRLTEAGVHLIDLTMGEDPLFVNAEGSGFEQLLDLVSSVKAATGLAVMVSPGVMNVQQLGMLAQAGATWYACYQETHNPELFNRLRPHQDFDVRLASKQNAHRQGLLVEEGLLCGVGETLDDLADSQMAMKTLQADQIRAMTFVPQPGTPMSKIPATDSHREIQLIAVMRMLFPNTMIPASLDVDGITGLQKRLEAGANLVTSIVPPGAGLAGVASPSAGIEDGMRSVSAVRDVLDKCGLGVAPMTDYDDWLAHRKKYHRHDEDRSHTA